MRDYVYSLLRNARRYTLAHPVREYVYSHGGYRGCARALSAVVLEQVALMFGSLLVVLA